jgi:DNA-binding beta-propeller fold protein YncE
VNLDAQARRAAAALHDSAEAVDPFGRLRDLGALERRRARTQVALAFVLLVALVAAGLLVGRRNDLEVVGPVPSRATIPVGRQPTTVVIGQGAVWVANKLDNSVSRIDPQTNRVVATLAADDGVADVAVSRDAVWTGGDRRGVARVVRIDPRTNRVVATVPVTHQPAGLAVTDDAVWVTSFVGGTLWRIDPQTNMVKATIRLGARPVQVAADDQAVWVACPQDNLVRRIDPQTNRVVATLQVAQPQDVALGFGSVWVPSEQPGTVLRIDPQTNSATSIRVAGKPNAIAVGADAVWVNNSDRRTVQRIDPQTNAVTATLPVASGLYGLAVDRESLWSVDGISDTVYRTRLPE